MKSPLHHGGFLIFHIVAQVIKTEFVVGAICDIGGIGGATLIIIEAMDNTAYGNPEAGIDLPHPL